MAEYHWMSKRRVVLRYNIRMNKSGVTFLLTLLFVGLFSCTVFARPVKPSPTPEATISAVMQQASLSASLATESAARVEPKSDLTQPTGEVKGRLDRYLDGQQLEALNPTNFIRHAIRTAVKRGVPANTIVLVLLFPVIAALVAAARHLIGLRGFGIYIPAVLSVAFVATGVVTGIVLFLVILGISTYGMRIIRRLKMQYLPRMALLLWLVSLGILATIFVAPYFGIAELTTINIFPILILTLLSENFHEVQMGKSKREATELTIETLILALISALLISLDMVQRFALLNPELLIVSVAGLNILVGKYVGLRFTEYLRFRKLAK